MGICFLHLILLKQIRLYKFLFVPQAWTIGVEMTFYLIAPFILRRSIKLIVFLMVCSIVLRLILYHSGLKHDPWTYRFFPTELIFFLAGNLSYYIFKKIRNINIPDNFIWVIGIILVYFIFKFESFSYLYKDLIFLILACISIPFLFYYTKQNKIDTKIGDLSYPVYISHIFIILIWKTFFPNQTWFYSLWIVLITIAFSVLLNITVTKRLENYRQSRLKK